MKIESSAYFYATNGEVLKNLEDLLSFLNNVDEETFFNHVNSEKNDLANWTRDILNEKRLSNKMFKTINRDEMAVYIEERLEKSGEGGVDKKSVISKLVEAIS
ncbi:MAG: hypothetical protein IH845_02130 [Nanoarchaeota archaeon]|nr:hypothetical protein [Nanoarchaeota archaeon]